MHLTGELYGIIRMEESTDFIKVALVAWDRIFAFHLDILLEIFSKMVLN